MAGVDKDMRSVFFGPEGSTIWHCLAALEPFALREARARDDMKRLAVELPVWKHGVIHDDGQPVKISEIRRFAALGLAIIIAEAGDLASYSSPARLWKRLGVGLHAGQAQGRLPTNATSEQGRELWKQHRYNPARRSRIWTLGEALVKLNDEGKYKRIYDTRKAYNRCRRSTLLSANTQPGHLLQSAVVFGVAVLTQALAASAFEPQRRGVEKSERHGAEQRPICDI